MPQKVSGSPRFQYASKCAQFSTERSRFPQFCEDCFLLSSLVSASCARQEEGVMRAGHHTERNRHWTTRLQNGRVATRLARGPLWRVVHAERNHTPSHSSRVSDRKILRRLRRFPRRREIRTASNVQHSDRSGISTQDAHSARSGRASTKISLLDLPNGAAPADSLIDDRRDAVLRSIRASSLALEKGAVARHRRETIENGVMDAPCESHKSNLPCRWQMGCRIFG